MIWKFAERFSSQIVTFVVSMILANLLDPSDYGTVTLVMIFITFANVFVSDGLGSALIRKSNADALDYSSVLYFNVGLSVVLYAVLYVAAPWITLFFGEGYEELTPAIRVLGIRLIFSAINSVQQAYVSQQMIFRKFFVSTLAGVFVSAVVGIWLAYCGYGVWALVAQYLINTIIGTLVLAVVLGKRPLLRFSFSRLKQLLGFGFGVLGVNLLITSYREFRSFLIGKFYTPNDLAFYKKGAQFPDLLTTNINTTISAVLFPRFAQMKDDKVRIKKTAKRAVRLSFYLVAPLLFGLAAVAESFVTVFLTEKWLGCVPYIWIFCVNDIFYPIHSTNMQLLKVCGDTKTLVRLEFIKKAIELVLLLIVFRWGVVWIALAMATTSTLFTYLNCIPTKKNIGYAFSEQIKDVVSPLIMCFVMFGTVFFMGKLPLTRGLLLVLQVLVGVAVYVGLSLLTRNSEFFELLDMAKSFFKKRAKR
ncbi:MAG: lipopolysaccharide biosynthesis protein [Clostridia bacterium]|nr:lipopolysaccharide biosynthesis protein [Clostridia bacterium]